MKIGFLLNITLLLCYVCSQVLIWLLDGTLVNSFVQLLDKQSTVFRKATATAGSPIIETRKLKSKEVTAYPTANSGRRRIEGGSSAAATVPFSKY